MTSKSEQLNSTFLLKRLAKVEAERDELLAAVERYLRKGNTSGGAGERTALREIVEKMKGE